MNRLILAFLLSSVLSASSWAQSEIFLSGNAFVSDLKASIQFMDDKKPMDPEHFASVFCYISGYLDMSATAQAINPNTCPFDIPKGVTVGQVAKLLDAYCTKHPEKMHKTVNVLLASCLMETFRNPKAILAPK